MNINTLLSFPLVVLLFLDGYEPQLAEDAMNAAAKMDHETIVQAFDCEGRWAEEDAGMRRN